MMDADKVKKFIAIGLVLYACVNVLMKLMPNIAILLPLPVYEFFYSITLNIEPSPPTPTETFSQEVEPNSS